MRKRKRRPPGRLRAESCRTCSSTLKETMTRVRAKAVKKSSIRKLCKLNPNLTLLVLFVVCRLKKLVLFVAHQSQRLPAMSNRSWSGAVHSEMVKKEGSVHISAKNEWAGHSEANTAAREVGESRVTPSVRAPVLVLHRSKYSA